MNGWSPREVSSSKELVVAASSTVTVSKDFGSTASGALNGLRVEVDISAIVGPVDLTLQERNGTTWSNVKTLAASATGTAVIRLHKNVPADALLLPLASVLRVVATTAAAKTVTVTAVRVAQEQ